MEQLTAELGREKYKRRYKRVLRSTIYTLIVVAAVAVLVATIWMPVLQIYGASMAPTLDEGDIVISVKGSDFAPGDLVAFYMGNKILVKRCIAGPGQWVDIDADGNPTKWKVENSWGEKSGHKGFLLMTDQWFNEYVFRLVVPRKYASKKVLKLLRDEKPVRLPAWDPMFLPEE